MKPLQVFISKMKLEFLYKKEKKKMKLEFVEEEKKCVGTEIYVSFFR